jgi:hypothetical protein
MNHVLKQTNKQTNKARLQRTFDIPLGRQGIEDLLRKEDELLRREAYAGWSKADLCREAWCEYVTRHSPGNPTPPLEHWTEGLPFSEAAQEKLTSVQETEAATTPTIQPLTEEDLRVWGEATLRKFLESPSLSQEYRGMIEHELHVRELRRGRNIHHE